MLQGPTANGYLPKRRKVPSLCRVPPPGFYPQGLTTMVSSPGSPHHGFIRRVQPQRVYLQGLTTMVSSPGSPRHGFIRRVPPQWFHPQGPPVTALSAGSNHDGFIRRVQPQRFYISRTQKGCGSTMSPQGSIPPQGLTPFFSLSKLKTTHFQRSGHVAPFPGV
eukprot:jgi/Botrbrau1/191/Bobra.0022s0171.1